MGGMSHTRASERRAICDACEVPALECEVRYKRELQAACGKTCWFNRFIRRASSCCPADPPKWLAVRESSLPVEHHAGSSGCPEGQGHAQKQAESLRSVVPAAIAAPEKDADDHKPDAHRQGKLDSLHERAQAIPKQP